MAEETVVQEQEEKQNNFHIYKSKSSLHLEPWFSAGKVMLKIAPAVEGKKGGQPEKGSQQYSYDNAITIGFRYQELLKCSYAIINMIYYEGPAYNKFADLSKVEGKDLKGNKKLTISPSSYNGKNGEVYIISFNLSLDDKKVSIALDYDEAYAFAKHLEFIYQYSLFETFKRISNGKK